MSFNYSFVKTPEEIQGLYRNPSLYSQKKVLNFSWIIDDEVYRKLLPPGLEPTKPVVSGFIAYFVHSGFSLPAYAEGALFLQCASGGVPGVYCLAMPIQGESEMGILLGRELYSYPKKVARIKFYRRGDELYASVERNGITFFEIRAEIGEANDPEKAALLSSPKLGVDYHGFVYLLDYKLECVGKDSPAMENLTFNHVKLFRQNNREKFYTFDRCKIEVTLRPSEDDPWIELAPKQLIGGSYQIMETEMLGTELAKIYEGEELEQVIPHLFTRYDTMVLGKKHEIHI